MLSRAILELAISLASAAALSHRENSKAEVILTYLGLEIKASRAAGVTQAGNQLHFTSIAAMLGAVRGAGCAALSSPPTDVV
jgi:hypothetical protein